MIGRVEEKKLLQSLLKEEEPQFVAVFGRRRIGKTYLIREAFNYKFTFQHTGVSNIMDTKEKNKKLQLEKFLESLKIFGYKGKKSLKNWNEAFNALKEVVSQSKDEKKVIFIDELSWMDSKDGELIVALESFWNSWATARAEKDIILIICASATYWMIDNVVNSRGGLHNRLTDQIYLKPFTLKECEEYLQNKNIIFNRHQILQLYMIMGGVPFYWSLIKKGKSLAQNIDELFFKEGAKLRKEYYNLYDALFSKPNQYMKIVEALSTTNRGISRENIIKLTGINGSGDLTKKLTELENCGFIRKYIPFGYNSKNCLYQLIDNYTLFYYKFIKDQDPDENFWQSIEGKASHFAWSGLAFERVCFEHISQIKKALNILAVYTDVNSWQCTQDVEAGVEGSQIDLLIVRKDQIINVCEIKYADQYYVVSLDFVKDQMRKITDLKIKTKTNYAIHPTLITTYGVKENVHSAQIQNVVTMDDLFS